MPLFDIMELHECIKELAKLDKEWLTVPNIRDPDQFYARMVHFSTDKTLGVRTPQATKMLVILNPVMLKQRPISLKCSYNVNKNWPLGHGQYRVSGNLGPEQAGAGGQVQHRHPVVEAELHKRLGTLHVPVVVAHNHKVVVIPSTIFIVRRSNTVHTFRSKRRRT